MYALQFAAKKLDKRLLDLGAEPIIEKGLGDDQHPSGYDFNIHHLFICYCFYIHLHVLEKSNAVLPYDFMVIKIYALCFFFLVGCCIPDMKEL